MNEVKVISNYRWRIVALLFFATTINYLDRQVIGLLKPVLEDEFHWSETDYSNIVIWFQVSYAIGLLLLGKLIDRVGTKIGYTLSVALWSLAAMAHALAKSTLGFSIARGALGISEAGNFPAAIKTVAEWFPKKQRALATGIFNSGANIGANCGPGIGSFYCSVLGLAVGIYFNRCCRFYLAHFLATDVPAAGET